MYVESQGEFDFSERVREVGDTPPLTIAGVMQFVRSCPDFTDKQRQDRLSAFSTITRICTPEIGMRSRDHAQIEAAARATLVSCAFFNSILFRRAPAFWGLTDRRFENVLALVRDVGRRMGWHAPELPKADKLAPPWQHLHAQLSTERRRGTIAYMGYCSMSGILPPASSSETLAAFETWSVETTIHRDPHERARRVASNWNWAAQHVAGWPAERLSRPGMRDEYTLPLTAYPPSFQEDVKAYLTRLACRDEQELFPDDIAVKKTKSRSPRSRRKPLADRTLTTREYQIRLCAAALVQIGHAPESLVSLRDLVQPTDRARAIIIYHRKRTLERQAVPDGDATEPVRTTNLGGIGEVLRQIAYFHCTLPEDEAERIGGWARVVTPEQQVTMTEKNKRRLRALMAPEPYAMLLHYPQELMRRAVESQKPPLLGERSRRRGSITVLPIRRAALLAMYAVVVEIVTFCPLRRDNLGLLRLDRHLHRRQPTELFSHLHIPIGEVKNRKAIDWPVSPHSARLIETYLREYRPHIAEAGNPYLFPGSGQKGRSPADIAVTLTEKINREFGVEFNLHLMRHFAALRHLRSHPGEYEIVQLLLGHKSVEMTKAYYTGLESTFVMKMLDAELQGERAATELVARAAFARRSGLREGG